MGGFSATSDADRLAGDLSRAGAELAALDTPNARAGELVAAGPAPRKSGRLAAGVQTSVSATAVAVFGTAAYWTFVHWGAPRRNVPAQPWLLAQLNTRTADIIDIYAEHATTVVASIQ